MIDNLDRTLEELLKRLLSSSLKKQISISFAAPESQFPPSSVTLPAIDLFLYDIRENRELRSNEWTVERTNRKAVQTKAPVRVDCSYLITAWPSESAPNPAQDEHHLLGEVMKVLLRHPTIPEEFLQGSLREQELPLPVATLQPGRLQSLGEFWQALGGKPKASLHYTVTISVAPDKPVEEFPLVTDKHIKMHQL